MEAQGRLRQLEKNWDYWIVAAAMIVSFLGTFTSTQLMIQARLSGRFSSVLTWTVLVSLTFGLCSTWSLHFVGMLACRFDLPIGLDVGLTLFSALLAILFTISALGFEMLWESYYPTPKPEDRTVYRDEYFRPEPANSVTGESSMPLLGREWTHESMRDVPPNQEAATELETDSTQLQQTSSRRAPNQSFGDVPNPLNFEIEADDPVGPYQMGQPSALVDIPPSESRYESSRVSSMDGSRLDNLKNMAFQGSMPSKNAFVALYEGIYAGMCWKAILMGLVWSLSITCMHYGGIAAMEIPGGLLKLNPVLVLASAIISWLVCIIGYIYMVHIEPHLSQQILFSIIAALGIAAMHFTGMRATTFWSVKPPSDIRGYPSQLPIAVCSVAILTCMLANGLLAHNATVSRNKLAEIVWTRRKLWRTLAQKENAEAAAIARSNFIATASHEIRTPLHHLQGYSDLLSRTELNEEGRLLLLSIQRAIKTLSLITNNVLDWSKLESDRDASCRPVSLDIRSVCESILVLLPTKDDEVEVEVMVVIAPSVPKTLLLDETYIHRILMNLLSNSLKFTRSGYVILSLEMNSSDLVVKVRDTGIGVPPSFLHQLFEPFSQAQTRGSQRGTGLGLSIVKKLLHKMDGTISVESQHGEEGFSPNETGTTSIITIPANVSVASTPSSSPPLKDTVALFHPANPRILEGLKLAWELFGYQVVVLEHFTEMPQSHVKYVWADSRFLQDNPDCLQHLISQDKQWTILVPFDNQESLQRLPGILSAPHFVPLQKPLMWHTFDSRVAIANRASPNINSTRFVRFASEYCSVDKPSPASAEERAVLRNVHILLVEDNPINQKLGNKMLTSLGYSVLLASDGDEAISQVLKHDTTIEMILMDQSMPTKDGVTATREIRALESGEKLSRRHPIVALTAVVGTESRAQFKDAGADDFLAKPLSMGKLEQTLATFLRVE